MMGAGCAGWQAGLACVMLFTGAEVQCEGCIIMASTGSATARRGQQARCRQHPAVARQQAAGSLRPPPGVQQCAEHGREAVGPAGGLLLLRHPAPGSSHGSGAGAPQPLGPAPAAVPVAGLLSTRLQAAPHMLSCHTPEHQPGSSAHLPGRHACVRDPRQLPPSLRIHTLLHTHAGTPPPCISPPHNTHLARLE